MTTKHTPGPWKVDIRTGCFAVYPAIEDHPCLSGAGDGGIGGKSEIERRLSMSNEYDRH